jgi:glutamine amidotransferase
VKRFPAGIQVPHMGWNRVVMTRKSPLFRDIPDGADFYFVHSYIVKPQAQEDEIARTDHNGWFAAAVGAKTIFGVQFHPEKSQRLGLLLLKNFAMHTERGFKTA